MCLSELNVYSWTQKLLPCLSALLHGLQHRTVSGSRGWHMFGRGFSWALLWLCSCREHLEVPSLSESWKAADTVALFLIGSEFLPLSGCWLLGNTHRAGHLVVQKLWIPPHIIPTSRGMSPGSGTEEDLLWLVMLCYCHLVAFKQAQTGGEAGWVLMLWPGGRIFQKERAEVWLNYHLWDWQANGPNSINYPRLLDLSCWGPGQ